MSTLRRRTNSEKEEEISYNSGFKVSDVKVIEVNDMTCRDRTGEFMAVVKSKQGRIYGNVNGYVSKKGKYEKQILEWNNFMQIANQIGKDISSTFSKLEKLTLLAKKRSLFDDKPVEIQDLTYIIKQDINSLNTQISQLQEICKGRSNQGKHMQSHSNSVVLSLQSKLASISSDFRHVLEMRTENLKHQKNRQAQFTKTPVYSGLSVTGDSGSVLLSDEHKSSDTAINMDHGAQYQQLQLLDQQDSYIQERADTMENIEATIVELGTIFQQLAHMVQEQQELVQRIDSNVEDTQLNVEAAHSEILKYFQSVTSNRWLMIKIFGVLILFFIIFVVFVA